MKSFVSSWSKRVLPFSSKTGYAWLYGTFAFVSHEVDQCFQLGETALDVAEDIPIDWLRTPEMDLTSTRDLLKSMMAAATPAESAAKRPKSTPQV